MSNLYRLSLWDANDHDAEITDPEVRTAVIDRLIDIMAEDEDEKDDLRGEYAELFYGDNYSWPTVDENMRQLSAEMPNILFNFWQADDEGDEFRFQFLAGKMREVAQQRIWPDIEQEPWT